MEISGSKTGKAEELREVIYTFTHEATVATTYTLDIEADSFEEAMAKHDAMGPGFFAEAEVTSERVLGERAGVEYVDEIGNLFRETL